MRQFPLSTRVLAIALIAVSSVAMAQDAPRVASNSPHQPVVERVPQFTFILFWRDDNQPTQLMNATLKDVLTRHSLPVQLTAININDPAQQAIVERYRLSRAPMPMVMCIAANGAVTGAILDRVTEEGLLHLLVTPTMTQCIKALQDGQLVLVHVKGDDRAALPTGAAEFAADPAFQSRTVAFGFRRDEPSEQRFLSDLEILPQESGSTVALLAPPGVLVGKYAEGASKDQIAADLHAAGSCCSDPNCKHNKKGK